MCLLEKEKQQTNLMQFGGDRLSISKVGRLHYLFQGVLGFFWTYFIR